MKAVVLGAGPAGIFATHALRQNGHEVTVLSKQRRKSFMRGAQYLHHPIPGLSPDEEHPFTISYELLGDEHDYRDKVYAQYPGIEVSPGSLLGEHDAWDIRAAYDAGWGRYDHLVYEWDATTPGAFNTRGTEANRIMNAADLIVSTIPAPMLNVGNPLAFPSETVWSTDRAVWPVVGGVVDGRDNVVVCSGLPGHEWYRTSRIQGWENTEYAGIPSPETLKQDMGDVRRLWRVEKPICPPAELAELMPPRWKLQGRYGKWRKGVLSHEAYYEIKAATA